MRPINLSYQFSSNDNLMPNNNSPLAYVMKFDIQNEIRFDRNQIISSAAKSKRWKKRHI